jgi:hypothetical protein
MSNAKYTEIEWECTVGDTAYTSTIIIPLPGCPVMRATRVARMVTGAGSNEVARKIFDEARRDFTELKPNGSLDENLGVSKVIHTFFA